MATRVFELSRELGVTSKAVLAKCRAEGIDLKNHMAVVSAGLEATIREWFTEGASQTAVETAEHVDLGEAREEARKQRRRRHSEMGEVVEEVTAAAEVPVEAEPEAPVEEPLVEVEPSEVPDVEEQVPSVPVEPEVVEEAPAPPAPPPAEPKVQPEVPPAATAAKAPEPKPAKAPVRPAGPQLVPAPAKVQGPRVVRVEKPDVIRTPRRRGAVAPSVPQPAEEAAHGGSKRGKGKPLTTTDEESSQKAGAKRRSPRRRGGRSAESGEGLKEWRDKDLAERSARLAAAVTGLRRRRPGSAAHHDASTTIRPEKIEIDEPITVKKLSAAAGIKSSDIIRKLMGMGVMATVNQVLDQTTAEAAVVDFGVELAIKRARTAEEELAERLQQRPKGELVTRAPVVTFLGHVDHGKTSLLDRIRTARVASGEAGGITQHIGAYRFDRGNSHVVFLDTPGHEAFTAMRSRGANMTDVVVLVVAADDGVMPQTVEALSHAKAAGVPIVVAMNKIDMPNANEQRVMGQLSEHGLQPREWGGTVEVIRTSAVTGQGMDTLVETLSLEAELLELKAEPDGPASGFVIEAQMDPGMGVVSRLLVRDGTLHVGDILLAGKGFGRVRQILDDLGHPVSEAGPSTPVEVAGLSEMPEAGDRFYVVSDLDQARTVAEDRAQRARTKDLATARPRTLESMLAKIEAGQSSEIPVIFKADVQGSLEAVLGSLAKLSTDEVRINVLHSAVGGITTGDVSLAEASGALIVGFNVVPDASARQLAEREKVDIRLYRIIYDILDDIRKLMEEGLAPEIRQETIGRAEVRQVFKISRVGTIAGCFVLDGMAQRNAKVRVIRGNVVIEDERQLDSLKRFKDDAREVRAGMECGLKLAGYDDIKEGDVLEFYQRVEVSRTL